MTGRSLPLAPTTAATTAPVDSSVVGPSAVPSAACPQCASTQAELDEVIADLRAVNRARLSEIARQQAIISVAPDPIHVYDVRDGTLSRANTAGRPIIGFSPEAIEVMSGRITDSYLSGTDRDRLQAAFADACALADGEVLHLRHRVRRADATQEWLSRRMTPFIRDADGTVSALLVVSRDVSDVVEVERQLKHASLHDELTGLPNRRLARQRLDHSRRQSRRGGCTIVLVCDLDDFKRINDQYGHEVGDHVLVQAASRLSAAVRPTDTVARMGGDEFVAVLHVSALVDAPTLAAEVALRMVDDVARPISVGGIPHLTSVSIGIRIGTDEEAGDDLLRDADGSMYYVKARGGGGFAFFEPHHHAVVPPELEREAS